MSEKGPPPSAPPAMDSESSPPYPVVAGNMNYAAAPPPSYQSAMAYPSAAPPYPPNPQPQAAAPYPAGSNVIYPNVTGNAPYPNVTGNAPYPPPQPGFYAHPNITVTTLPQPPAQPARVVVVTQTTAGPNCGHCGAIMQKDSDVCCILCLVLLTIFTFPFGLLFLCCLPCAVQMRCSGCGRTN